MTSTITPNPVVTVESRMSSLSQFLSQPHKMHEGWPVPGEIGPKQPAKVGPPPIAPEPRARELAAREVEHVPIYNRPGKALAVYCSCGWKAPRFMRHRKANAQNAYARHIRNIEAREAHRKAIEP